MSLLKSIVTLASTPVRCLGELGIKSSTFFQRLKNGLNPFTGERV